MWQLVVANSGGSVLHEKEPGSRTENPLHFISNLCHHAPIRLTFQSVAMTGGLPMHDATETGGTAEVILEEAAREFLLAAQNRDEKAMNRNWPIVEPLIRRVVYSRSSDESSREDLFHDVCETLVRTPPNRFPNKTYIKTLVAWVYEVAKHRNIDHFRSMRSRESRLSADDLLADCAPSPQILLERAELVRLARLDLEENYPKALPLFDSFAANGILSGEEMADLLRTSQANAYQILSRMRRHLKDFLEQIEHPRRSMPIRSERRRHADLEDN
jgi:RNA polymerase sigma factor (sigma-70 family)